MPAMSKVCSIGIKSDPNLVDESWRTFFSEMLGGKTPSESNGQSAPAKTAPAEKVPATEKNPASRKAKPRQPRKPKPEIKVGEGC